MLTLIKKTIILLNFQRIFTNESVRKQILVILEKGKILLKKEYFIIYGYLIIRLLKLNPTWFSLKSSRITGTDVDVLKNFEKDFLVHPGHYLLSYYCFVPQTLHVLIQISRLLTLLLTILYGASKNFRKNS